MHRLRRLRRRVPEQRRPALHRRPSCSTSTCSPRARPSAATGPRPWSRRWSSSSAACTNHGECQEACPKEISIDFIAMMNRDYLKAKFANRRRGGQRKAGEPTPALALPVGRREPSSDANRQARTSRTVQTHCGTAGCRQLSLAVTGCGDDERRHTDLQTASSDSGREEVGLHDSSDSSGAISDLDKALAELGDGHLTGCMTLWHHVRCALCSGARRKGRRATGGVGRRAEVEAPRASSSDDLDVVATRSRRSATMGSSRVARP